MKRRAPSIHESLYAQHLVAAGVRGWQTEMPFAMHLGRRWRFDFAFPAEMLAVELQGGTWVAGSRAHGHGYSAESDAEKLTVAAILGWRVLAFTARQVNAGWALLATEIALGIRARSVLGTEEVKIMAQAIERRRA